MIKFLAIVEKSTQRIVNRSEVGFFRGQGFIDPKKLKKMEDKYGKIDRTKYELMYVEFILEHTDSTKDLEDTYYIRIANGGGDKIDEDGLPWAARYMGGPSWQTALFLNHKPVFPTKVISYCELNKDKNCRSFRFKLKQQGGV